MATPTPLALYWIFRRHAHEVLQSTLPLRQTIDDKGRPSTRVLCDIIRFTLDTSDVSAELAGYMLNPYMRAHSYFEAEYEHGSRQRWLDVQAAYLVRFSSAFEPGRPGGWPGEVLHLGLSPAAIVRHGITLERHTVLPWDAPAEVQRRARLEGWPLAQAAAMPAPKEQLKVAAPAQAKPPVLRDNADKGVYGEHVSDAYMRAQGHTKLNDGGLVTPPPPGGSARGNGLDGVWQHASPPPDYIITEAKYGKSRLGMTQDGRQMSDTWITGSDRLKKAVGQQTADDIVFAMGMGLVEKRLHKVDAAGTLTQQIIL